MEDVEDEHGSNGSISGSTGGIWYLALSESSTGQSGGWGSREREAGGSEGREPHLNTLACTLTRSLARSRVFLVHRGNACAFHLVFAPSRDSPSLVPPAPCPLEPL